MPVILEPLLAQFGNKPFMAFHTTAFSKFSLANTDPTKKSEFKKTVKCVLLLICQLTQMSLRRMGSTSFKLITAKP